MVLGIAQAPVVSVCELPVVFTAPIMCLFTELDPLGFQ